jgi:hypothetical protein
VILFDPHPGVPRGDIHNRTPCSFSKTANARNR